MPDSALNLIGGDDLGRSRPQGRRTRPTLADRDADGANLERPGAPQRQHSGERFIGSGILHGYRDVVTELGGDPDILIGEAGLGTGEVPQAYVRIRAVGELLENSAKRLGCPDFGLRLAEKQRPLTMMRPLERVIRHADTVERTLSITIDHMAAFSSGLRLSLVKDPHRIMYGLRIELLFDAFFISPQLVEQLSLLSHRGAGDLTAGSARVRAISFSHVQLGSRWDYARRFSAPVAFDQDFDEVFFSESDIKARSVAYDETIFSSEYEKVTSLFPPTPLDIKAVVRQAIRSTLAESVCCRDEVCTRVGFPSRTLHRKLTHAGTNFENLRDEVRRSLCLRYLARRDLTITEIATRLGFAEGSVLTHTCQKWFSSSPREIRRRLLQ